MNLSEKDEPHARTGVEGTDGSNMKTLILCSAAALIMSFMVGCESDDAPTTVSTTTTESTSVRPVTGVSSTETHTVRSY